jgi:cytochrome c
MKKLLLVAGVLALGTTPALASVELATKSGCLACHAVDHAVLGPAYRDVAKKYAGQKDAEALLIQSVRKGVKGKYGGPLPEMPAQTNPSDADVKALVQWILKGAK